MVGRLTSNSSWHIKLILENSISKEVIRLALINSRYKGNTLIIHGLPYVRSVQYNPLTVALLRLDLCNVSYVGRTFLLSDFYFSSAFWFCFDCLYEFANTN